MIITNAVVVFAFLFFCLFVLFIYLYLIFFRDLQKSIANQPPEQTPQAPPHHQALGTVPMYIIENTTGCPHLVGKLVFSRKQNAAVEISWMNCSKGVFCYYVWESGVSDF